MGEASKPQYIVPLSGSLKGMPIPANQALPGVKYSPSLPLEVAKIWSTKLSKGFTEQELAAASLAMSKGADPARLDQVIQMIKSSPALMAAAVSEYKESNSGDRGWGGRGGGRGDRNGGGND